MRLFPRPLLAFALLLSGCPIGVDCSGMTSDSGSTSGATGSSPYQEIYDQGLTKYVGTSVVTPTSSQNSLAFPHVYVHKFGNPGRGPLCMRGADYFVETRDGPSDDLMIFLEGGGVCLDEICAATVSPMLSLRTITLGDLVGIGGILDHTDANNPAADYDVVHAPYCDGSIFLGDVDRPLDDGKPLNGANDMAYQRGLLNLTATMEVAKRQYPNPRRVILGGTSGGGYGVLLGVALARYYYPNKEIVVIADSGAPVLTSEDPSFIRSILEQLNGLHLIPASCPDCISNGHATGAVEWAMDRDTNVRFAYLGHARDHVIGEYFMGSTAEQFEASVVRETGRLVTRFPGRGARFIVPGDRHMLTLDIANVPSGLQHTVLQLFGTAVFTGPDITAAELGTWTLGGMKETGHDASGTEWTGYRWLTTFLNDPAQLRDVVELGP